MAELFECFTDIINITKQVFKKKYSGEYILTPLHNPNLLLKIQNTNDCKSFLNKFNV